MKKLRYFLFLFFILIEIQNCSVQTNINPPHIVPKDKTLYPEIEGYENTVELSSYIKTIKVGSKVYETDKLPDPLPFDAGRNIFSNEGYTAPYKGEIKTDFVEFVSEDRKTQLNKYPKIIAALRILASQFDLMNSKLKAGESGYMLILFKNPDKNNEKTFIKIHIKRTS